MTASRVELDVRGRVAHLTMTRPEALNAFDAPMIDEMRACVAELSADRAVRAVLLSGRGRSFSIGVDAKAFREGAVRLPWFRAWHEMTAELERIEVPVVAAIRGRCLGGGVMLTLTADYRIAADDLHIGLGSVRYGLLPGSAPQRLPGVVGSAAARRLCLFGEYVGSHEALRIGLVDRVVPSDELDGAAIDVAERAAFYSPLAVRELKSLLRQAPSLDDDAYRGAYLDAQERCLADYDAQARQMAE